MPSAASPARPARGAGQVNSDNSVARSRDATFRRGVRDRLRAEAVVVHAAPGVEGHIAVVASQPGDLCVPKTYATRRYS